MKLELAKRTFMASGKRVLAIWLSAMGVLALAITMISISSRTVRETLNVDLSVILGMLIGGTFGMLFVLMLLKEQKQQ